MRWVAALLAAVGALLVATGCGGGGAEPGAPRGATLVLDFTPNAGHTGIYAALARGDYRRAGVDLTVREPGSSTDAPKLLAAGRADFAILDIHDLGIARERGLDVVGVMPIVQRPLASVIARADRGIASPRDLQGRTVGVTGLPSDDAVVDSEVDADGGDPEQVKRVTIGFNAVASLAAGKVDAATGFWNAEAVALRRRGVPIHVFKVDDYGAPRYPELVLCTSGKTLHEDPGLVRAAVAATRRGYRFTVKRPMAALDDLLEAVPSLDRADQAAQLRVLLPAFWPKLRALPIGFFDAHVLLAWLKWDVTHGILEPATAARVGRGFDSTP
jgi:NitT/TauT family transport system substrate-binding protein/putative hydroxymethylpyrimidine transport system substrate-binding protein